MLRFLVLASFAALALAQLAPEPRYLEDVNTEERIVGGEVADANSWPWKVSLEYWTGSTWHHICTGALVKTGWVLTSAMCADSAITLRVVLGEHDIYNHEGREQYISVSRVYLHPNYDIINFTPDYDIALLRLSSDASLNNYVQLAVLPPSGLVLSNNPCYLTGWGYSETTDWHFPTPTQTYLPIIDLNTCSSWLGSPLKTTMVCAGGYDDSGCQDIFFGPLNCSVDGQWVVLGVASFVSGPDCMDYGTVVVSTRVSVYISWINSIIG